MRLAAIYIDAHEYLFENPQVINLGGEFIYSFNKKDSVIYISRKRNDDFLEGFFDKTNLDCKLLTVNAIVGQNGTGKSSILDSIRSLFIENSSALPINNTFLFFETENKDKIKIVSSIYDRKGVTVVKSSQNDLIIPQTRSNSDYQTIYYSPHFDFKHNPNFDNIDNFDISFDKFLEEDLEDLSNKKSAQSGWNYSPSQELLFKNSIRQILFLASDLVNKEKIFHDLFNFPQFGDARLVIRGHKEEKEWNTPSSFRPGLAVIKKKLKEELDDWHKVRKFKSQGRVSNQIDVNKYILKRNIIGDLISVLERQMEKQNTYLSQGRFEYENFERDSLRENAHDSFLMFIDSCYLSEGANKIKAFDYEIIKQLIHELYSSIDKIEIERNVENEGLVVNSEDAIKILQLQRDFIHSLFNYYDFFYENKKINSLEKNNRIDGFINYMPTTKRLSSGENALLNLFSRLYDFLNSKLSGVTQQLNQTKNYILLLDEADLGFHPVWKKKFVNSIIKTIPYFFNMIDSKPTIQILFTTHDPLTLSDLPNKNIVYLYKDSESSETKVLDYEDLLRPNKSFAANITDLLADSFYIEDGLIGDFAKEKLKDIITWLDNKDEIKNAEKYKSIVKIIDEPIVQRKLAEMYDSKMEDIIQISVIEKQIKDLENLKKRIQK